jgi:hypothetical protein
MCTTGQILQNLKPYGKNNERGKTKEVGRGDEFKLEVLDNCACSMFGSRELNTTCGS